MYQIIALSKAKSMILQSIQPEHRFGDLQYHESRKTCMLAFTCVLRTGFCRRTQSTKIRTDRSYTHARADVQISCNSAILMHVNKVSYVRHITFMHFFSLRCIANTGYVPQYASVHVGLTKRQNFLLSSHVRKIQESMCRYRSDVHFACVSFYLFFFNFCTCCCSKSCSSNSENEK